MQPMQSVLSLLWPVVIMIVCSSSCCTHVYCPWLYYIPVLIYNLQFYSSYAQVDIPWLYYPFIIINTKLKKLLLQHWERVDAPHQSKER